MIAMFAEEYRKIGLNVLYHRRKKGLTQLQLAHKSGVSRSRISDIENGKELFRLESLLMIAKALEVDYRELLLSFDEK